MKLKFLVKTVAVIDYDTEGRTIHILHPNGFEEWKEYYDDGKKVHRKDSEGEEKWLSYEQFSDPEDDEEARLIQYLGNRSVWYEREVWENGKRKRCVAFRKITLKEWLEEKLDAVKESRANKKLKKLGRLAQSGSGKAMFAISEMYVNHKLNPKNGNSLQLAHEWNQKSAEAGYPPAMANEAWFHICGWKKPSSLEKAFSYLQAAVNSGYKKANMQLYECYRYGWGTEPNYEKARDCLKAVSKFDKRARATLKLFTKDKVSKADGEAYLAQIRGFYN